MSTGQENDESMTCKGCVGKQSSNKEKTMKKEKALGKWMSWEELDEEMKKNNKGKRNKWVLTEDAKFFKNLSKLINKGKLK